MSRMKLLAAVAVVCAAATAVLAAKRQGAITVIKEPTTMPAAAPASADAPTSPLDFQVTDIDGKPAKLSDYRGKVVLIVNVASKCGYTKQYDALEKLYTSYQDQGFVILGFPANNFGSQEPGTDTEIKQFCTSKFNVTFPMMSKISVKGDDKAPLYKFLTEKPSAGDFAGEISWNFNKFLVDRNGNLIARFDSAVTPDDPKLVDEVKKALAAK